MNQAELILEYRTQIRDVVPVLWAKSTAFVSGQRAINGPNVYLCVVGGMSSVSGSGPQGTTLGQADGTVVWNYFGAPSAPALSDLEDIQLITDGFRTFSKYRPLKKSTTINVVAGQSTYTLPNDWMDRDYESWNKAINPAPVVDPMSLSPFTLVAMTELIGRPMAAYETDVQYDFYPGQLQLVITPVPQMSYTLTFDYFAYHTFDASSCTVPYHDIDNALLPGLVKGIRSIAMDYSVKLQMYMMSNSIQVDNRTVSNNLLARANELDKQFERDIIKRPIAVTG